jgi:hypothetical protein
MAPARTGSNPLASPQTRARSHYLDPSDGALRYPARPHLPPSDHDARAYAAIRAHVLVDDYPCVMARSVFNRDAFRMATYRDLGAPDAALLLCHDLYAFSAEFPAPVQGATSFIACFDGPSTADESGFETALWQLLQAAHEIDRQHFGWCAEVGSDPERSDFSFSLGGRAFFLIGMHPAASRLARRTPMPVIVFNLHEQFVELRTKGKYDAVRDKIQQRDIQLQGTPNPMAADFGERSEAAQYSGRHVGRAWRCPFAPA